ncbi:MAG: deoxyribodipyrimidine photo-lyase [Planctomycetota bacterium]|jgi:deoxyribodipyrimidine photo-lyase
MIHAERIKVLNSGDARRGKYVLYWMQQSQRAKCNHALEHAIRRANDLGLPCVAVFGITQRFPEAQERHYAFMLEGLRETKSELAARGVQLVVRLQPPADAAIDMAEGAALLVADCGYLRVQRGWRSRVASRVKCPMEQVEADVVVPVQTVSSKEQYAARTIRPRIEEHLERFLVALEQTLPTRDSLGLRFRGTELGRIDHMLSRLRIGRQARWVDSFHGGTCEAERRLADFAARKLHNFASGRNDPAQDFASHMSPYLHFGQISPLQIALAVSASRRAHAPNKQAYLEELIVRRELSMNFCQFNARYDEFDALPDWAVKTLREHAPDKRPYRYSQRQLERAETHDPYWSAAQREMLLTGKMHGYMRMYWGKKIIEWTADPRDAFRIALRMNNRYELDGRDPNSFAGVAWCFGKHDRPWRERDVFGTVRYMSDRGLERKFDMDAYVSRVEELAAREDCA